MQRLLSRGVSAVKLRLRRLGDRTRVASSSCEADFDIRDASGSTDARDSARDSNDLAILPIVRPLASSEVFAVRRLD